MIEKIKALSESLEVARKVMLAAFQAEETAYESHNRAMHRAGYDQAQRARQYDEAVDESAAAQENFKAIEKEWLALMGNSEAFKPVELQGVF